MLVGCPIWDQSASIEVLGMHDIVLVPEARPHTNCRAAPRQRPGFFSNSPEELVDAWRLRERHQEVVEDVNLLREEVVLECLQVTDGSKTDHHLEGLSDGTQGLVPHLLSLAENSLGFEFPVFRVTLQDY